MPNLPDPIRLPRRQWAVRKEAAPSTHLWKVPVPANLEARAYSVSVRAVDEYGRRHAAHTVLEIADAQAPVTALAARM